MKASTIFGLGLGLIGSLGFGGGFKACSTQPKYKVDDCLFDVEGIGRVQYGDIYVITAVTSHQYELHRVAINGRAFDGGYSAHSHAFVENREYFYHGRCELAEVNSETVE
jgi:hypothetical protein